MTQRRQRTHAVKPTLAQVAAAAEVSRTTASRVLNNRPNCWASEETRNRILSAAEALDYRPNVAAQALSSGRTRNLGLIMAAIGGRLIDGFHESASEEGFVTYMSFNVNNPEIEDQLIRDYIDRGIDGLAIYPSDRGDHTELRALIDRGFPVVSFDGAGRIPFDVDDISIDYPGIGRMQAQHLLDLGRRNICIASPRPAAKVNDMRETAAAAHIAAAGATVHWMPLERNLGRDTSSVEETYPQVLDFMRRHGQEIDGIIGYDVMASVAIRAVLACELRIPDDIAVIGAGNSVVASCGSVPITSIDAHDREAGIQALHLLLARQRGGGLGKPQRVLSKFHLVTRASTVAAG